jgi:hypothetical protein
MLMFGSSSKTKCCLSKILIQVLQSQGHWTRVTLLEILLKLPAGSYRDGWRPCVHYEK